MKLRLVIIIIAFLLQSCNSYNTAFYRDGAGTELSYGNLATRTDAQNVYINYICRQAGAAPGQCSSVNWNEFVLAGMNDIDSRCDSYLAWLDNRRRSQGPFQKQITDTLTTTTTVMTVTGATATSIGIVAAAFGFAHNTFDNAYSRLLMEVDNSTVQTIVLTNQTRFRKELSGVSIGSQPEAIYALRQYLRLCMPFTIENQINTTIVTYQRGGTKALEESEANPLIGVTSLKREAATPRVVIIRPRNPPIPTNAKYDLVVKDPGNTSTRLIRLALANICATPNEIETPTEATVARVKVLQQWRKHKVLDGKLDSGDIAEATGAGETPCDPALSRNYYEKRNFGTGLKPVAADLIPRLNDRLPEGSKLAPDASEETIRRGIAQVRARMAGELELNDPALSEQMTLEFENKL